MEPIKKVTRILIVDDEAPILDILSSVLGSLGYIVSAFSEGEGAFGSFLATREADTPFDVVFLDLENGLGWGAVETMKHMREVDPNVKVILMSGNLIDPVVRDYAEHGFLEFIPKPFSFDEIDRLIQLAVSHGERV